MTTANTKQLGNVPAKNKAATEHVLAVLDAAGHDCKQVWGVGGGDHADGYATDFMVYSDRTMGDFIADYLWEHRADLGVRWIIWRQRIRSTSPGKPGTWQAMEDRGSVTQNHYDHVHVKWNTAAITVSTPYVGAHRTYTIPKGGTLGKAAIALGVTVGSLAAFNGIRNPDVVHPGQVVTAPPAEYRAPAAPAPAKPAPAPAPAKPAPAPAKPAPKPVVKPAPATNGFRPIANQHGVYRNLLKVGSDNSTSVYRYEQALRKYLGASTANRYDLTAARAADGYYGTATAAATKAAYKRLGVTPWATEPGPYLLKVLGVGVIR